MFRFDCLNWTVRLEQSDALQLVGQLESVGRRPHDRGETLCGRGRQHDDLPQSVFRIGDKNNAAFMQRRFTHQQLAGRNKDFLVCLVSHNFGP